MKKLLVFFIVGLFVLMLFGCAIAEENSNLTNDSNSDRNSVNINNTFTNNTTDVRNKNSLRGIGQQLKEKIKETKQEIKGGNYTGPMGKRMMVKEISKELREIRIENFKMKTKLNMSIECEDDNLTFDVCNKTLTVMLRNGTSKEIKVMPDTAAEKAIERLGLKICNESNNCTIELKDVGGKKLDKLRYQIQVERHRKLFGLFKLKSLERAEVNPETGDTIVKKPWWAFLAREVKE